MSVQRRLGGLVLVILVIAVTRGTSALSATGSLTTGQAAPERRAQLQSPAPEPSGGPEPREQLTQYLAARTLEGLSAVVLVSHGDDVLVRAGYGHADYEAGTELGPEHIMRIASLTKTFTATAILMLAERGEIDLHAGICPYFDPCPTGWGAVTPHQLLTHTSGIPDAFGALDDAPVEQTAAELERVVSENTARLEPGTAPGEVYAYSNFNYVLLGYLLEKTTGLPWERFLIDNLFIPLQMTQTRYDDVWAIVPGRARGYDRVDGSLRNDRYDDHSAYAAGGLRSTIDDMHTFARAYFEGGLISEETRAAALLPYVGEYGYGWQVTRFLGRPVYNHTGSISGFTSHMAFYPNENLLVVVLSNVQNDSPPTVACDLAAIALAEPDHIGAETPTIRLLGDALSLYAGRYEREDEAVVELSVTDRGLRYQRGNVEREYLPVSDGVFVMADRADYQMRFQRDSSGTIRSLTIDVCGTTRTRAERSN